MKESHRTELKPNKTKEAIPADNIPVEESEKSDDTVEESIEKMEPLLEEITQLGKEIEERFDEIEESVKNPAIIEKNNQILGDLLRTSETFLRKISEQLADYPKGVAESFRDMYIRDKTENLRKRLNKSKEIYKYKTLKELRSSSPNPDELEALEKSKKNALKSFDNIYKSCLPIIKTIEGDNWSNSKKNGTEAVKNANYLLDIIVQEGITLERYDEVFEVIKLYENSPTLSSKIDSNQVFSNHLNRLAGNFNGKNYNNKLDDEKVSEMCRNDPYLILRYLDKGYDFDLDKKSGIFEKQLDKIMEEAGPDNRCNISVNKFFDKGIKLNPEKYGLDPKNREVIFESFKTDLILNGRKDYLNDNIHFFNKELEELSEENINRIIDTFSNYDLQKETAQLLLSFLDMADNNLRKIFDKLQRGIYFEGKEEKKESYSKELLFKDLNALSVPSIPFIKYKQFDLSPEIRVSLFKRIIKNCSTDEVLKFLNQVLSNYNDVFDGISEDAYEPLLQDLIKKSIRGDIENIRSLHTLLPGYDIPLRCKEQINRSFLENYSGSHSFNNLFKTGNNKKEFSKHEEWLMNNNEIAPELEKEFYHIGDMNDFRHFFFDVMEGKKESVDKDLLINKYAERIYDFGAEEFVDLFVIRKKIPMSYSEKFVEKISGSSSDAIFNQLEGCVRLNQITDTEYNNLLVLLSGKSNFKIAEKSLNICLDKKVLSEEEKGKLFEDFVKNIVKQLSKLNNSFGSYELNEILSRRYRADNINNAEKKLIFGRSFEELLTYNEVSDLVISITNNNPDYFNAAYPDEKSKQDFISKLIVCNSNKTISKLLDGHFDEINKNHSYITDKHPIFANMDEEKFNILFGQAISLDKLNIDTSLARHFESLPQEKKEIFLKTLLSKKDILEHNNSKEEVRGFCAWMASVVENDRKKEEDREISAEDSKNIFANIFSSKSYNSETTEELLGYQLSFLVNNKDILDKFIDTIEEKGSANNQYSALRYLKSEDSSILSPAQVKKLSLKVLEQMNIDEEMYRMYLNSTEENKQFYLDQESLNKNINKIFNSRNINVSSITDMLILQRNTKNTNKEKKDYVTLSSEKEEYIVERLLSNKMQITEIEKVYDFDKEMFDKSLDLTIKNKNLAMDTLTNLVLSKEEISEKHISQIIDFYFANYSNYQSPFNTICDKFSKDPVKINEIKNKINSLPNIENRSTFKSTLLQKDLLSPEELKQLYQDIRSESNVYSQVLLSAEVMGSMVSSTTIDFKKIFSPEGEEVRKNVEFISSFVKKYPLESKGRTIAVMLFSKEYLPERNMEEVIAKVAETLSKYERTLKQYEYKGIPTGLRASIGMEYEITGSTSEGYRELKNRELKSDIVRLSQAAHIGNGRDAVHEIATRPTTNPYLMLLEMQLLNDIEYIDLNFERTELYQKGARGYHITIGGENGLNVNADTNFLQNSILAASWGGIHAGEIGKRVSGGRGVTLRGRSADGGNNNVKVFDKPTNSVELRSLSVDKMEPFQRAVTTVYNGAIAIQALEKYTNCTSDQIYEFYKSNSSVNNEKDFIEELKKQGHLKEGYDSDEKNLKIVYAWAELTSNIKDALDYHNNEFLSGETSGYLDKDGAWVDTKDFGGTHNSSRFDSVVSSIDPTLSVEEYVNSTKMDFNKFFSSFDVNLADNLTRINNLYLKPDNKVKNEKGKEISLGGDQANAISMLEVTKLNNENLEYRNDDAYLKGTIFDTLGERREGYYCVQGGSEKMITHACQIALLNFNKKIEEIVNK